MHLPTPFASPRPGRAPRARLLAAVVVLLTACGGRPPEVASAEAEVGTAACLSCHGSKSGYLHTAHYRTSSLPSDTTVAGSFSAEHRLLRTSNPALYYRMDSLSDGYHQTAVTGTPPDTVVRSQRMDLVVGSGRKGQTYLGWRDGNRLYQLPVGYWTGLQAWTSNPGYRESDVNFDRPVAPRCLECHATRFQPIADEVPALIPDQAVVNRYDPAQVALGISCERCHGPGRAHVERQASPIRRLLGQAIVNPSALPRQRQIDVCAQCHGGLGQSVGTPFSYVPGRPLEEHVRLAQPPPGEELDVHGNQVALLARSACFQKSSMTCATCHDPHVVQRDSAALSAKCLGCHQMQQCGEFPRRGQAIRQQCTNCHMPDLPSSTVIASFRGTRLQSTVRTHWIKVYPRPHPGPAHGAAPRPTGS